MKPYVNVNSPKRQEMTKTTTPIKFSLMIDDNNPKASPNRKNINHDDKYIDKYIDFEAIQTFINIKDKDLFAAYLKVIFKDLSERTEANTKKWITKLTFYEYIKLPIFIADKLFSALDRDKDGYLNGREFIEGWQNLYTGNFDSTLETIFNLFDFDKDGWVRREDVKILWSYLPLKSDNVTVQYKFQMESLDEIEDILNKTFWDSRVMNWDEFKYAVETNKSDVYWQVLCFLYQKKPFNSQSVNTLINSRSANPPKNKKQSSPNVVLNYKNNNGNKYEKDNENTLRMSPTIKLLTPSRKTTFSPVQVLIKSAKFQEKNFWNFMLMSPMNDLEKIDNLELISEFDINNNSIKFNPKEGDKTNTTCNSVMNHTPLLSGIRGMIRMNNEKHSNEGKDTIKNKNLNIQDFIKNSTESFSSPSTYWLNYKNNDDELVYKDASQHNNNINNSLFETENLNWNFSSDSDDNEVKEEKTVYYENWVYKVTDTGKLKHFYLVLINKDLFYYKTDAKEEVSGMHNLSGCFVKGTGQVTIQNTKLYSFQISSSKVRQYYTTEKETANEFVENIKKGIGYLNFFDYYEMWDDIGEGKFGWVKLGIHKRTKERVAIKIIKNDMKIEDLELVRSEIDIMKLCHHVNIVHWWDHFENSDYIFIVMEYISSGDWDSFLQKQETLLTEDRAADFWYQIASGIQYWHKYGIVHRDWKPENVMLNITKSKKDKTEKIRVKIMDFGWSKIMGPSEKLDDGFGTLNFVAPEVLLRTPYNKEIDIWSIGVIWYYMLSGKLPFDDPNENEEIIANKTVYSDVEFPWNAWKGRSPEVIDWIKKCLTKEPNDRIKIEQLLEHPWMLTFNANRKESLDICHALININQSKKMEEMQTNKAQEK